MVCCETQDIGMYDDRQYQNLVISHRKNSSNYFQLNYSQGTLLECQSFLVLNAVHSLTFIYVNYVSSFVCPACPCHILL